MQPSKPSGGEGSGFKSLKPPELSQFRRFIESGNIETVKTKVWSNPRYLISSGDTPTILQVWLIAILFCHRLQDDYCAFFQHNLMACSFGAASRDDICNALLTLMHNSVANHTKPCRTTTQMHKADIFLWL